MRPLNLFYAEPDPDRWFPLDRYPRRLIRRLIRGRPRVGGQQRVFLNLCAGLDRLQVAYRVNDYRHARRRPAEVACVVGKPFLLDRASWKNPILFGSSVFAHPMDDPQLLTRLPVRRVLVPGEWFRTMFASVYGEQVQVWPVGIDTHHWRPNPSAGKAFDFLLYDKVRWRHEEFQRELIEPITQALERRRLRVTYLRYGHYREEDFHALLGSCRAMVFLCEHETQGIAYQQALSCGAPVLAWDRGGFWQDPEYYPHKVRFAPVTSVPYWDECCGVKFRGSDDFSDRLDEFLDKLHSGAFAPRDYILGNLTLEQCAMRYVDIVTSVERGS